MRRLLPWLFLLGSCGTLKILNSPSHEYRAYAQSRVQKRQNFDRGRMVLTIKVLAATRQLKDMQERVTPGHGFEYKENLRQVIVAVGLPNASDFSTTDLKMSLGGRNAEWLHEIDSQIKQETHYFFAHPFHRIFLVDFSKPEARIEKESLEIRSPRGVVTFDMDFSETANAP